MQRSLRSLLKLLKHHFQPGNQNQLLETGRLGNLEETL